MQPVRQFPQTSPPFPSTTLEQRQRAHPHIPQIKELRLRTWSQTRHFQPTCFAEGLHLHCQGLVKQVDPQLSSRFGDMVLLVKEPQSVSGCPMRTMLFSLAFVQYSITFLMSPHGYTERNSLHMVIAVRTVCAAKLPWMIYGYGDSGYVPLV